MKKIIFSGINILEGGPLTIMKQFHDYAQNHLTHYEIYFIVNNRSILSFSEKINVIELKKSKATIFHKLYYEYFYFKKLSKELKPDLWISLNDVSPSIISKKRVSYWHNPTPFYSPSKMDLRFLSRTLIQPFYYPYLYKINAKKNDFIIVQQRWIKNELSKLFSLDKGKFLISHPCIPASNIDTTPPSQETTFIYPALPRVFKNIELIGEATKILEQDSALNYRVILTLSGTENRYARWLKKKYGHLNKLQFLGRQDSKSMARLYEQAHCLIFPSKLETWGLPISEFKQYNRPILAADLPYAHETIGEYQKAYFFDPFTPSSLANAMKKWIQNEMEFSPHHLSYENSDTFQDMGSLFARILNNNHTD